MAARNRNDLALFQAAEPGDPDKKLLSLLRNITD